MEDSRIIELYWKKDTNAIKEIDCKYGAYCFTIANNILHSKEDSEECVNDTWLKAWNAMPPQRPGRLQMFLARITRNLSLNRFNSRTAEKRGGGELVLVLDELTECLATRSDVEGLCDARALGESVRLFVWKLPEQNGNVFVRRYFFTESIAKIAKRYDLTENNVTVILSRIRKKLKLHLEKEGFVCISRLDGELTQSIGKVEEPVGGKYDVSRLFVCKDRLIVLSQTHDDSGMEERVSIRFYDISLPKKPVLQNEFTQLGHLTDCWMADEELLVITSDGACACGWSRLEDETGYFPALSRNGETVVWGDEDILILGSPVRVEYSAMTIIDSDSQEIVKKKALYGNMQDLFYGKDWIAVTVGSESEDRHENPVLYTFDGKMNFTGKISTAQVMGVPEKIEKINIEQKDGETTKAYQRLQGNSIHIVSVAVEEVYRILETYTASNSTSGESYFLAITADPTTGEAGARLLSEKNYPSGQYTEIHWEKDRAVVCMQIKLKPADENPKAFVGQSWHEARFVFVEFDRLKIKFYENELRADYLSGQVGCSYGNPLGSFRTLIPMGNGLYVRYSKLNLGPGGFDVFDFSDSAQPRLCYRSETSLAGKDAFDYNFCVYNENTFGTVKANLGDEEPWRNFTLSWCVYSLDLEREEPIVLEREVPLKRENSLSFFSFKAGGQMYYISDDGIVSLPE